MRWLAPVGLLLIAALAWLLIRGEGRDPGASGAAAAATGAALEAGPSASTELRASSAADGRVGMAPAGEARAFGTEMQPGASAALAAEQGQRFHGQVLAAEDDRPLADVEVACPNQPSVRSDAEGRFSLGLAGPKAEIASLRHPDRELSRFRVDASALDPALPLRLRLRRTAILAGRIAGLEAQAPARVVVTFAGYQLTSGGQTLFDLDTIEREAAVAPDGTFELAPLPSEVPLAIQVLSGGRALVSFAEEFVLAGGERRQVAWSLTQRAQVRVHATDPSGAPAGQLPLELFSGSDSTWGTLTSPEWDAVQERSTDLAGMAVFDQVRPGRWLVAPKPPGPGDVSPAPEQELACRAVAFEVPPGASEVDVQLETQPGLWICGRVLTGLREPVDHAPVNALSRSEDGLLFAVTDPQGNFSLGPVPPGRYQISMTVAFKPGWCAPEPVEVEAGAPELELILLPSASIQVRLIDGQTGDPVAGEVRLQRLDSQGYQSMSGGHKSLSFPSIQPGRYHLIGVSSGGLVGCLRDVELVSGATPASFDIPVNPGGEVRVRYEGPQEHASICVMHAGVHFARDGLRSGTSDVFPVPLGDVTVRFERRPDGLRDAPPLAHEATALVVAGTTAEIDHVVPADG